MNRQISIEIEAQIIRERLLKNGNKVNEKAVINLARQEVRRQRKEDDRRNSILRMQGWKIDNPFAGLSL